MALGAKQEQMPTACGVRPYLRLVPDMESVSNQDYQPETSLPSSSPRSRPSRPVHPVSTPGASRLREQLHGPVPQPPSSRASPRSAESQRSHCRSQTSRTTCPSKASSPTRPAGRGKTSATSRPSSRRARRASSRHGWRSATASPLGAPSSATTPSARLRRTRTSPRSSRCCSGSVDERQYRPRTSDLPQVRRRTRPVRRHQDAAGRTGRHRIPDAVPVDHRSPRGSTHLPGKPCSRRLARKPLGSPSSRLPCPR